MAETKRRLPVLKSEGANDEDNRPPWHWAGFGTLAIFAAWLPLAYVASLVEVRILTRLSGATTPEALADTLRDAPKAEVARLHFGVLALATLPLAIGSFVGGYIVGRWSKDAGVREAAVAGLTAGLVASALSWIEAGFSVAPLASLALAVPMAALGGLSGSRVRAHAGPGLPA